MCPECNKLYTSRARLSREVVHTSRGDYCHRWLYDYDDIKGVLFRAKYRSEFRHFRCWADHVTEALEHDHLHENYSCVTSIPASRKRLQMRGYDHAALFARSIATLSGLTYWPLLVQAYEFHQTGLGRNARLSTPKYIVSERLKGHKILLIDDVSTTRTSLSKAVCALKIAGASEVDALTLAYRVPSTKLDSAPGARVSFLREGVKPTVKPT